MSALWIILIVLVAFWIVLNLPRKRADGELVKRLHPYRIMLGHMMPRRNDAVVYFDDYVHVEPLLNYLEATKTKAPIDITHCIVKAVAIGLHKNPKMNQFVIGKRLYARNHVALTFSMKRKVMDKAAKLSAVKLFMEADESFEETCRRINEYISKERSGAETYTDKEIGFLTRLPRPLLSFALGFVNWADYYNLLPWSFIKNDAFYTSAVIANLGSLGMKAGYHHLYEYGTSPLFIMVGAIEDRPMVVNGQVIAQKVLHLRYSYDERIDDGLTAKYGIETVRDVLENPAQHFGQLPLEENSTSASPETETPRAVSY